MAPLFHPESDKEANCAIQVADDVKGWLACLNKEFQEINCHADAVKAKCHREWQQLAEEQAEKYQLAAAEEKAEKDWLDQLAELEQVNCEVSLGFSMWHSTLKTWSGSCKDTGCGIGGWVF